MYLSSLESESIHIIRESARLFKNKCVLFSGGKDSVVLAHLVRKAFYPLSPPFELLHIDTGHNFPEITDFIDLYGEKHNFVIKKVFVQDDINMLNNPTLSYINTSRNKLQSKTLLRALHTYGYDVALAGARRDEEKSRAKERIISFRDTDGHWSTNDPSIHFWSFITRSYHQQKGHFRVFPLSDWTELDIWLYIKRESIEVTDYYYSSIRDVICTTKGIISAYSNPHHSEIERCQVRVRTIGDIYSTGFIKSNAKNVSEIINEINFREQDEREGRFDDRDSVWSMEERKRQGYF